MCLGGAIEFSFVFPCFGEKQIWHGRSNMSCLPPPQFSMSREALSRCLVKEQAPSSYLLTPHSSPRMSGAGADSLTHAGSQAAQSPGGGKGGPVHRPFSIMLTPQAGPNPEKQRLVKETGQFYPSYTIAHYRLSKKTPLRVNHQIQDEKILI